MKALRLPAHASPVTYLFRFRGPRDSSAVRARLDQRSRPVGGPGPGQGNCSAGCPVAGLLSRGRERDLSGSQAIHPVPLPRSKTPAEPTIPRHDGLVDAAPAQPQRRLQRCMHFEATHAASAPAAYASRMALPPPMQGSLPAGWLAFAGRELNPLDRDERFQNSMFILLSWTFPDAR